jgi:PmbA protein
MSELQAIADAVIAQAKAGEQVEAFVSRDSETDIRVYEGEVEHFVSAQSEGIGIRIIRDGCTGFAYAGTLDPAAIAEVSQAVTMPSRHRDEWAGLAEPDGVASSIRNCGTSLRSVPHRPQDRWPRNSNG